MSGCVLNAELVGCTSIESSLLGRIRRKGVLGRGNAGARQLRAHVWHLETQSGLSELKGQHRDGRAGWVGRKGCLVKGLRCQVKDCSSVLLLFLPFSSYCLQSR